LRDEVRIKSSITVGEGGWIRFDRRDLPDPVFLRYEDQDGRLALFEVLMTGRPITTDTFRQLRIGAIERQVNGRGTAEAIRRRMALVSPDPRGDLERSFGKRRKLDRKSTLPIELPNAKLPPRASGTRYGDDFYRAVADVYAALAEVVAAPVNVMQEANNVDKTTIYEWIKQARARGYLPPGRRGKAG
jgi:hypothetical protein